MRVLLTRPREDAEPLAERLRAMGIEVLIEPLLAVTIDAAAAPDLDGVQAILATSANGVRAFAALSARRDIPLLAVGDATARAAQGAGFHHFESAAGNVETLAALAAARCDPARGALLHVAGSRLAGDLGGLLEGRGFAYRRAVLYAAQPAERLSAEAAEALKVGQLDGVLFFSPRTADTFVTLVRQERLVRPCRRLSAFCLSAAVAERARAVAWRRIAVATHPDQDSLLTLLTDPTQGPWGTMTETPKTSSEPAERPEDAAAEVADLAATSPEAETSAVDESADPGPDATPAAEPSRRAPKPVSRAGVVPVALLTTLFLLAVIGGALYAAWPFWSPYVAGYVKSLQSDPLQDPRLNGLAGRVATLEGEVKGGLPAGDVLAELETKRAEIGGQVAILVKRVDDLEASLESVRAMVKATTLPIQAADARKALDELSQRMAQLEQSGVGDIQRGLGRLEAENRRTAQSAAELTKRVDGLEVARSEAAGLSETARALIVAAGQLREALRTSAPFADELAAVKKVAGDQPDLARIVGDLTPYAETGIPVLATLGDRFDAMASATSTAAHRIEGGDWMTAVANRLSSLVTIRRTDAEGADDTIDGRLARAQAAMRDGDLIAAVKTLEGLADGPAAAAAPWLKQARARVLAERAMAVLHVQAVSLIAPAGK